MFAGTISTQTIVVLGTAVIRVQDNTGVIHPVRILLDSVSQVSSRFNSFAHNPNCLPRYRRLVCAQHKHCVTYILYLDLPKVIDYKYKLSVQMTSISIINIVIIIIENNRRKTDIFKQSFARKRYYNYGYRNL